MPWGEFLLLVRVYLAQQHYAQALAALEGFSAQLDRPGDIDTTIHFLALQVVVLHCGGQSAQARAVAARLLALTTTLNVSEIAWSTGYEISAISGAYSL